MKTKMTLLLASMVLLSGCQWLKDAAEVTIDTDLVSNITVVAAGTKAAGLPEEISVVNFSQSATLSLAENADVEPYLEKIREVNLQTLEITINGIPAGQTINGITLSVEGVGVICTQTNITSTSNVFTPTVDTDKLNQAGAKLKEDHSITLTVSGSTTGVMTFVVVCVFGTEIVAGALD